MSPPFCDGGRMHLFSSIAEVSEAIREVGLGRWHDQLFGLIRPTVRYIADAADSPATIGASRAGGTPDLPSTLQWPIRPPYPDADVRNIEVRDHPANHLRTREQRERDRRRDEIIAKNALLPFIAQIDLADAWRRQQFDINLPKHGRLLFFYDARETPYGFGPPDATGFRVIWDESSVSDLVRAADPEELSIDSLILPTKTLCPAAGFMLPHWESFAYDALNIPVAELDRYSKLSWPYDDVPGESWYDRSPEIEKVPHHYLGGWGAPSPMGHLERSCELVRMGFSCGRFIKEEVDQTRAKQAEWCLLAEFDCEGFLTQGLEHEWFTGLTLHFLVTRDDLAAQRFDRVWTLAR
jgi:hypothetical protein